MTKFTNQENATRKQVFAYIRNNKHVTDTILREKFGRSKVVMAAITEARRRIANGQTAKTEHQLYFADIKRKAKEIAMCLPSSGYSMGEHKMITNRLYGMLATTTQYNKDVVASYDNAQEYARSSKFRATHGEVRAELPVSILAKAEVLDSMITVRTKQVQNRIWKCEWLVWDYERNKRGFITSAITWHMEKGYVVRREETSRYRAGWFHSSSLKLAREMLTSYINGEKAYIKSTKEAQKREIEERKKEERKRKEQEKAAKLERSMVMKHGKRYTQKDVNRAAWKIFGKIASRQDSYLYRSLWGHEYRLNINKDDAFECDVKTAFETICKEHDVVAALSKHNSRERQAKYWSEQPANILQHPMVVNFDKAIEVNEKKMFMPLPYDSLYAYGDRDKRILKILAKMFRRKQAIKQEIVTKSAELADALQHMYVYRDSIAAGNCVPGTDGFLADHNLQKTDTRSGEFLLRISRGTWQHANVARAIEHYINKTSPDFYMQNRVAISNVLSSL